jgi:hypothetical protein
MSQREFVCRGGSGDWFRTTHADGSEWYVVMPFPLRFEDEPAPVPTPETDEASP